MSMGDVYVITAAAVVAGLLLGSAIVCLVQQVRAAGHSRARRAMIEAMKTEEQVGSPVVTEGDEEWLAQWGMRL